MVTVVGRTPTPLGGPLPTDWHDRTRLRFGVVGVVGSGLVLLILSDGPTDYSIAQWYFAYEHGTFSRSLIGTIFQLLGGDPARHLTVVSIVIYSATAAVLLLGAVRLAAGRCSIVLLVAGVTLFAHVIPHLANQLGRLDGVVILLAAGAVAFLSGNRSSRFVWAGLLLTIAVLVHEAAMLLVVVWVATYAADIEERRHPAQNRIRTAATLTVPAGVAAVASVLHMPSTHPTVLAGEIFPATFPSVWADFATRIHFAGLSDHVAHTVDVVGHPAVLAHFAVIAAAPLVIVAVAAIAALRLSSVGWAELAVTERALFVVSAAPLLLAPIAHDWHRWSMFSGLLLGGTAAVVLSRRDAASPGQRPWILAFAAIAVGWALLFRP